MHFAACWLDCFHLTNSSVPNLLCRAYSQQAPVAASAPLQAAAAAAPLMDFGFDDRGQLTTASQLESPASAAPMDLLGMYKIGWACWRGHQALIRSAHMSHVTCGCCFVHRRRAQCPCPSYVKSYSPATACSSGPIWGHRHGSCDEWHQHAPGAGTSCTYGYPFECWVNCCRSHGSLPTGRTAAAGRFLCVPQRQRWSATASTCTSPLVSISRNAHCTRGITKPASGWSAACSNRQLTTRCTPHTSHRPCRGCWHAIS